MHIQSDCFPGLKEKVFKNIKITFENMLVTLALCLVLSGLQHQEVKATTILRTRTKTAGQLLDQTFLTLKSENQGLKNADEALQKKVKSMAEEIKVLEMIHGNCAPCQAVQGTDKYCDCTRFPPKKDCLEFHKAGFKVRIVINMIELQQYIFYYKKEIISFKN